MLTVKVLNSYVSDMKQEFRDNEDVLSDRRLQYQPERVFRKGEYIMELGEGLKKILLAGIGTAAVTAEKSKEILDDLVKKGELTVEQGKVLNQELKHNIKSTVKSAADSVKESTARKNDQEELKATISKLTPEQLAAVKAQIESMQAEAAEKKAAEEAPAEEAPAEEPETEDSPAEETAEEAGSEATAE